MALKICNVRGDGNCYYRCIWNIVKDTSADVRDALGLAATTTEDAAVVALRSLVARMLDADVEAQNTLQNLWELGAVIDLTEQYPLASRLRRLKKWESVLCRAKDLISRTKLMASELEHTIMQKVLTKCEINIVIVSHTPADGDLRGMPDKWVTQLRVLLPKLVAPVVGILVNEDYIHYKYVKFRGDPLLSVNVIPEMFTAWVEESSDEDE
jgi:hypothetical protein